jgi:hypothetical protein
LLANSTNHTGIKIVGGCGNSKPYIKPRKWIRFFDQKKSLTRDQGLCAYAV